MTVLRLFCWTLVLWQCVAFNVNDVDLSNCTEGSQCDDETIVDVGTKIFTENTNVDDNDEFTESMNVEIGVNVDSTTSNPRIDGKSSSTSTSSTVPVPVPTTSRPRPTTRSKIENNPEFCPRDLTVPLCDTFQWCDSADCNGTRSFIFHNYAHDGTKFYDYRCCDEKNGKHRNRIPSIFRRLARYFFCVAYDNRAPIYRTKDGSETIDPKSLEDAKHTTNTNKYTWEWKNSATPLEFNFSSRYDDADGLWKLNDNKTITLMELPQSGFTGECKLGKVIKYRESSKWTCMQTDLSNKNAHLFSQAYENFTVISSPHLFNSSNNRTCPKNVCLPVRSLYCTESPSICNSTESLKQWCLNGNCQNVIKRASYTISTDQTLNIQSIEVRFVLTNATKHFYQYFEVDFQKNDETGIEQHSSSQKASIGYKVGDAILMNGFVKKTSNNATMESKNVEESPFDVTLPLSKSDGNCDSRFRHAIRFGEDIRLRCRLKLTIHNFSSDDCVNLRNLTLKYFFDDLSHNVTDTEKFDYFLLKNGDEATMNNETIDWTKILINEISQNLITAHVDDNRIGCSGLMTKLMINVFYTILPKFDYSDADRFKIVGVSMNLLEGTIDDASWPRCSRPNCENNLEISLVSFVSFVDVSTPSMYYYAGSPNLHISLPHDFFYPFMSGTNYARPSCIFVHAIVIIVVALNIERYG